MDKKRKSRVPLAAICKIGTLAHNRDFSPSEYRQYTGRSSGDVAALVQRGLLRKTGRGRYYPTGRGWGVLERSCRLLGDGDGQATFKTRRD
jgi:hypothetical protein